MYVVFQMVKETRKKGKGQGSSVLQYRISDCNKILEKKYIDFDIENVNISIFLLCWLFLSSAMDCVSRFISTGFCVKCMHFFPMV